MLWFGEEEEKYPEAKELETKVNQLVSAPNCQNPMVIDKASIINSTNKYSDKIINQVMSTLLVAQSTLKIANYNANTPVWNDVIIPKLKELFHSGLDTKRVVEEAFLRTGALITLSKSQVKLVQMYGGAVPPREVCDVISRNLSDAVEELNELVNDASKLNYNLIVLFKQVTDKMLESAGARAYMSKLDQAELELHNRRKDLIEYYEQESHAEAALLVAHNTLFGLRSQHTMLEQSVKEASELKAQLEQEEHRSLHEIEELKKHRLQEQKRLEEKNKKYQEEMDAKMKQLREDAINKMERMKSATKEVKETKHSSFLFFWNSTTTTYKNVGKFSQQEIEAAASADRKVTQMAEVLAEDERKFQERKQDDARKQVESELEWHERLAKHTVQVISTSNMSLERRMAEKDNISKKIQDLEELIAKLEKQQQHRKKTNEREIKEKAVEEAEKSLSELREVKTKMQNSYGICGSSLVDLLTLLNGLPEVCLKSGSASPIVQYVKEMYNQLKSQAEILKRSPANFPMIFPCFIEEVKSIHDSMCETQQLANMIYCGDQKLLERVPECVQTFLIKEPNDNRNMSLISV